MKQPRKELKAQLKDASEDIQAYRTELECQRKARFEAEQKLGQLKANNRILAAGMAVERMELLSRSGRIEMRISALGFDVAEV